MIPVYSSNIRSAKLRAQAAFSLIEVVVAFAILAGLGVALVQSQLATTGFLNNTKQRDYANTRIQLRLQTEELNPLDKEQATNFGEFEEEFPLDKATWELDLTPDTLLSLPMRRVTFTIRWEENGVKKSLKDFILIEPSKDSLNEFLQQFQ